MDGRHQADQQRISGMGRLLLDESSALCLKGDITMTTLCRSLFVAVSICAASGISAAQGPTAGADHEAPRQ